jgi:hypothetical protein
VFQDLKLLGDGGLCQSISLSSQGEAFGFSQIDEDFEMPYPHPISKPLKSFPVNQDSVSQGRSVTFRSPP